MRYKKLSDNYAVVDYMKLEFAKYNL